MIEAVKSATQSACRSLPALLLCACGHHARCAATAVCLFVALVGPRNVEAAEVAERPNVVLIMADDLGYSDLGCYGSEIATPNLDGLAAGGLRFTQFYNTARCWPTRAALLTGYYAQQVRRDTLPGVGGGGGHRNRRPDWARLLPDMLTPSGYRCYHSGKWHLDGPAVAAGFHESYILKDQGRFFHPQKHFRNDTPLPPIEKDSGFYGTVAIADHAIRCLQDHVENHSAQPFFHYVAFTAPHFPLHALPDDIAKYADTYASGWDAVRNERYARQQQLSLHTHSLSAVERDVGPPYAFPEHLKILGPDEVNHPVPWDSLTPGQRQFQADKMSIHAAMIDRMDQEIGRILNQLQGMNCLDNTLVLFLSDNGASAEIMVRDDGHNPEASPGSAETYLCLGPGWSTACNTPFRRHKTWVHEGGISTPLIVHWPHGLDSRGELRTGAAHVIDIVPTILNVCDVQRPKDWQGTAVPAPPGVSLKSMFERDCCVARDHLWWLHDGHRAIRCGDWKLVSLRDQLWELYDLRVDRAEQHNLANDQPQRVRELKQLWTQTAAEFEQLYSAEQEDAGGRKKGR